MTTAATRPQPFVQNGLVIRRLRKRLDISQDNLAARVGTTRRHMIRLEKGYHLPSAALRDRIAEAVGADPDEIRSCEDEEEESSMPLSRDDAQTLGMFSELLARLQARNVEAVTE